MFSGIRSMHTFKKLPIMLPKIKREKRMNHSDIVCCLLTYDVYTYFLLIQNPVIKVVKITQVQMANLNKFENLFSQREEFDVSCILYITSRNVNTKAVRFHKI